MSEACKSCGGTGGIAAPCGACGGSGRAGGGASSRSPDTTTPGGPDARLTTRDKVTLAAVTAGVTVALVAVIGLAVWADWGKYARSLACILAVLIPYLAGLYTAARGAFASRDRLLLMADRIGTSSPTTARVLCVVALVVLLGIGGLGAYTAVSPEFRRSLGIFQEDREHEAAGETGGSDRDVLKGIIVKRGNIPVESVEITGDTTAVGTLPGGENLTIRWKRTGNKIECICQKPKAQAEDDVRKLISQMGFTARSVDIKPDRPGVGYVGEAMADNGVSFDVTDDTDAVNLTSRMHVKVAPRSYRRYARVSLENELNAKVTEEAAIQAGDLPPLNGSPRGGPAGVFDSVNPKESLFQGRFRANGKWYGVELYQSVNLAGLSGPRPGQPTAGPKLDIVYREVP
jgi:hypothetical protein